jgi:hypothetical protein
VKALACHLPAELGLLFSRLSLRDLRQEVIKRGIVAQISGTTIWRWLSQDAIRPWAHRSWIFPRDPRFAEKAGRALDLYARVWQAAPLGEGDYVLSADEMTGIQLRQRRHPTQAPRPGRMMRVEHEYRRMGTLAYLAAWDVHRAALFGRIEPRSTIPAFDRLVEQIMSEEPYRSAERVFLVVDNGTVHRGQRSIDRLHDRWPQLILVHLPIHASWLNQIEIYFSILKRKVLTPNDFASAEAAADRILAFQGHYQAIAQPFEWKLTRDDLARVMASLSDVQVTLPYAA